MKFIKKFFVSAVCLVSMCGCAMRTDIIPQYNLSVSTTEQEYIEISAETVSHAMQEQLSEDNNTVSLDVRIDSDTIKQGVADFKNKNPDFFWLDGYTIVTDNHSTKIDFNVLNSYTPDELRTMHSDLIAAADNLTALAMNYDNDYDKILFVHDYIINNTDYDFAGAQSGKNGIWGTSYGCLVSGYAVCQGYSEAFLQIMNNLGIECGVYAGESERGRHAWNYVNLNGVCYWLDLTWDDPESDENEYGKLEHKYFLINDEMLLRTRKIDDYNFIPECNSLEDNYFVRNNCYMDYYSADEIGSKMPEYAESREISIMFSSYEVYSEAVYSLFENGDIWTVLSYVGEYSEIKYSNDDTMYVITINF